MPLSYSIWQEIGCRLWDEKAVSGVESRASVLKRLRTIALKLPRAYVRKTIGSMKSHIEQTRAAKGKQIRAD